MILVCNYVYSVNTADSINVQLRTLFGGIHYPAGINYLYDMTYHIIDSCYYDICCPNETNANIWFYLYEELYNAAFYQNNLRMADSLALDVNSYYADTIPFGFIDRRFVHFPQNILAIHLDEFYGCDEEKGQLYDIREDMPLLEHKEVFMASPLQVSTRTLHPIFLIDLRFVFADSQFAHGGDRWECQIDFGDSEGFRDVRTSECVKINYPHDGTYKITTRVVFDGIEKVSVSLIMVQGEELVNDVDCIVDPSTIEGLCTFRFDTDCPTDNDKLIFILAGYNPLSFINNGKRTPQELYTKYIAKAHLEPLRDFGYTFIIVDYLDHNAYIQDNAMRVAKLLSYYRCHIKGDEQFVVIGHSMGCLVGRYALTYLERFPSRFNDCRIERMHNTRLFISNDGPHQGVNIPMSLQCLYGGFMKKEAALEPLISVLNAITRLNINLKTTLLQGKSVRQMLYYHYETDVQHNGTYTADSLHYAFLKDLRYLGDYPKYCKLVALSNGSIEGAAQQNYYSKEKAGDFRSAGDCLLHIDAGIGITVLGFRVSDNVSLDLRTNPGYNKHLGYVHSIHQVAYIGLLSGRIYPISRKENLCVDYVTNTNLLPYCVSAGGNEYTYNYKMGNDLTHPKFSFSLDLGLVAFGVGMGDGQLSIYGRGGIPWILNVGAGAGYYTDGLGFGFVPVQSAFDYKRGRYALDENYVTLAKGELFANTPFDAVIGRIKGKGIDGDMSGFMNFNHEDVNNPSIKNRLCVLANANKTWQYVTTDSISRLLAREIGDEELYLNNVFLPYHAMYSAALNIYVQCDSTVDKAYNPYYEYEAFRDEYYCVAGAFSRNGHWNCTGSVVVDFSRNGELILDNPSFNYRVMNAYKSGCLDFNRDRNYKKRIYNESEIESIKQVLIYALDGKFLGRFDEVGIKQEAGILPAGVYIQIRQDNGGNYVDSKLLIQ